MRAWVEVDEPRQVRPEMVVRWRGLPAVGLSVASWGIRASRDICVRVDERLAGRRWRDGRPHARQHWRAHPMGDPAGWPSGLHAALTICLNSRRPMIIWWGPRCFLL